MKRTVTIAADVGGTFTDLMLIDAKENVWVKKVLSTPPDFHLGVVEGVIQLIDEAGSNPNDVDLILHATTAATNAILEKRGPLTGLLTTKGFRDVLEIRRLRFPDMYNLFWEKPVPLVERQFRLEIDERIGGMGEVVSVLRIESVREAIDRLSEAGVRSIGVCFLNSYQNSKHEREAEQEIRRLVPHLHVSLSSSLQPELGEYERTSTTVVNAYLMPVVSEYISQLRTSLDAHGLTGQLLIMQSNGGMATADTAAISPVNILESGPAAGVIGARTLSHAQGIRNMVTFDMGGTTAKASMIEDGEVLRSTDIEIGAPISMASILLRGAGYAVRVPAIYLAEVGAGGGSVAYLDQVGGIHVGPHSVGSLPGPACYGKGGTEPTVTDANVVLGYLSPEALVGGELAISKASAEQVIKKIADPLRLSKLDCAYAIFEITIATMVRAVRAVSTQRGRDIRESALLAFGGNGPLFAAAMARELGMKKCIIPLWAGLFSTVGLINADIEQHFVRYLRLRLSEREAPIEVLAVLIRLEELAREELEGRLPIEANIEWVRSLDLHYQGQGYELRLNLPAGNVNRTTFDDLEEKFHSEHERTYGFRSVRAIEMRNVRLIARVRTKNVDVRTRHKIAEGSAESRFAYFGPQGGSMLVPVRLGRGTLNVPVDGPAIVQEYDTTILIPPASKAVLDALGNVVITFHD